MATKTKPASNAKANTATAQLIVPHQATNITFNKLILTQSNIRRIKNGATMEASQTAASSRF